MEPTYANHLQDAGRVYFSSGTKLDLSKLRTWSFQLELLDPKLKDFYVSVVKIKKKLDPVSKKIKSCGFDSCDATSGFRCMDLRSMSFHNFDECHRCRVN